MDDSQRATQRAARLKGPAQDISSKAPLVQRPRHIMVAIAAVLLVSAPCFAGQYVLEKGQGVAVCEAYENNLNSFKPKTPMTCARAVSPDMPDFAKPHWERPSDSLAPNGVSVAEPYWAMSELLWRRDVNPVVLFRRDKWPQWRGTPEQVKKAREGFEDQRSTLYGAYPPYIAEFDMDNDGTYEPMYLEQPCGSVYGARLAVLNPDWKTLNRKKTALVMPHAPFKEMGYGMLQPAKKADGTPLPEYAGTGYLRPVEDAWHWLYYDVFFYKGRTYFDQWWRSHPNFHGKTDMEVGRLRVFEATPQGTNEVCTYRFDSSNGD